MKVWVLFDLIPYEGCSQPLEVTTSWQRVQDWIKEEKYNDYVELELNKQQEKE